MSLQLSTAMRNALLDALETQGGTAPIMRFYTGSPPANCAASDSGTKIAEGSLPSDWMAAASSGSKAKTGTWQVTGVSGAGTGATAGYWRLYASDGTTVLAQGTITVTGSGGDVTLDNTSIANGQVVTFSSFSIAAGNS